MLFVSVPRCCRSIITSPLGSTVRWFTSATGPDTRPKRPLTAYIRYVKEKHPLFKKQYPDMRLLDRTKSIAQSWKELPDSEKQTYEAAAEKERQAYKEELNAYKTQLSGAQIGAMQEAMRQRRAKRKKMRQKRELTVLGKPKGPRSAFNIFMAEHFQDASGNYVTGKMKSLCDDWRKLPVSQKQPYVQLAEDDKIRYENEMKSWEEQMIEVGREDLIRVKNRKRLKKPRAARRQKTAVKRAAKTSNESESHNCSTSSPKTEKNFRTIKSEE
ncbi:hypothetical protein NDU88_010919 [Pleurodeles waltl]|uniref:Transcription factor A, mitochondrial n=1 Tax=Pleurodeles waltl TaxID=8319 RepID=A0AAV7QYN2_PLEWA|nr:hypothetical protein NDU88_010919 [Pleurodeles waltl]